jgi:hypothetical protein
MDPFPDGALGKAMLPALPFNSPGGHASVPGVIFSKPRTTVLSKTSPDFQVRVLKPGSVRASGLHAR